MSTPPANDSSHLSRAMIITAAVWVVISQVVGRSSTAIQSIFVSRVFTREEVGMLAVLIMLSSGIHAFTEMGHEAALIYRREEKIKRAINTAWVGAIIRGICLCALLALSAPWIAEFYAVDELTLLIQGSSLYFLVIGFKNLHLVRLTRAMKFSKPKLISSVSMMTGVIVTILTGLWTRSIWCVIWGGLSHRFVEVVGSHIFAPSGLKLSFHKGDFMELFRYGRNIQAIGILVFLVTQFDNAVIGKLLSMGDLAVYANAYLLANLPMTQIVGVASQVAFPAWSKVTREGTIQERNTMFLSTLRLTTALSMGLCLALFVGGADLIELIFGAKWRDAETPLRILLIFGLWRGIGTNFGSLFNALGKPHVITIEISIKFLCIALLIYPLTSAYGIIGASLAVVLPMGIITPIALWIYLGMAQVDRKAALHCLFLPAALGTLIIAVWWWASASGAMPQSVWIRGLVLPIVAPIACVGGCVLFDSELRRVIGFKSAKSNT